MRLRLSETAAKELTRDPKINTKKAEEAAKKKAEAEERAKLKAEKAEEQVKRREQKKAALEAAKNSDAELRRFVAEEEDHEQQLNSTKLLRAQAEQLLADIDENIAAHETVLAQMRSERSRIDRQLAGYKLVASSLDRASTSLRAANLLADNHTAWEKIRPALRKKLRDRRAKRAVERLLES